MSKFRMVSSLDINSFIAGANCACDELDGALMYVLQMILGQETYKQVSDLFGEDGYDSIVEELRQAVLTAVLTRVSDNG
jgi:hypothetical protein